MEYRSPGFARVIFCARFVTLACVAKACPPILIIVGGALDIGLAFAKLVLLMQVLEVRYAPPAPCPRAQAFADQRRHWWVLSVHIGVDFSQGDAETQAYMIIGLHTRFYRGACTHPNASGEQA